MQLYSAHYMLALSRICGNIFHMKVFLMIVLNTFVVVAIVYLLLLIVDISFVCSFSSIMKHHANDLTVILTNKKDNFVKLVGILSAKGVKLDKSKLELLHNFDVKRIEKHDGEDAKKARDELTSIHEYLLLVCSQSDFEADSEYQQVLAYINELEIVYRHHLMMYNADVLGYNFWISFFPTRYIYKILRFKPKENI